MMFPELAPQTYPNGAPMAALGAQKDAGAQADGADITAGADTAALLLPPAGRRMETAPPDIASA